MNASWKGLFKLSFKMKLQQDRLEQEFSEGGYDTEDTKNANHPYP
jgi:hypothetical protein